MTNERNNRSVTKKRKAVSPSPVKGGRSRATQSPPRGKDMSFSFQVPATNVSMPTASDASRLAQLESVMAAGDKDSQARTAATSADQNTCATQAGESAQQNLITQLLLTISKLTNYLGQVSVSVTSHSNVWTNSNILPSAAPASIVINSEARGPLQPNVPENC